MNFCFFPFINPKLCSGGGNTTSTTGGSREPGENSRKIDLSSLRTGISVVLFRDGDTVYKVKLAKQ
ncbi:MAG: hypothetical protein H0W61_08765 [Bacteroidetes bacterium]|nr:hypothetical protein [Bacteroidota bacterium]